MNIWGIVTHPFPIWNGIGPIAEHVNIFGAISISLSLRFLLLSYRTQGHIGFAVHIYYKSLVLIYIYYHSKLGMNCVSNEPMCVTFPKNISSDISLGRTFYCFTRRTVK